LLSAARSASFFRMIVADNQIGSSPLKLQRRMVLFFFPPLCASSQPFPLMTRGSVPHWTEESFFFLFVRFVPFFFDPDGGKDQPDFVPLTPFPSMIATRFPGTGGFYVPFPVLSKHRFFSPAFIGSPACAIFLPSQRYGSLFQRRDLVPPPSVRAPFSFFFPLPVFTTRRW